MDPKARILVVDNENTIRLILKTELKKAGYHVTLAVDAEEATVSLKRERFEVALIDKNLPVKDGIEFLHKCKLLDPDMELILMTGYATIESALEAIKIGVFDYITKPFDHIPSVIHRISRAVERRSQRDELKDLVACLGESNREVSASVQKLQKAYLETAKAMSRILGMRNPGRNDEHQKVRSLAVEIAGKLGMDAEGIGWLSLAILLRDVGTAGKIEDIIKRPEKLKDEEYQQVKKVPGIGADLLSPIPGFEPLAEIIRHHHEHFDGKGFPDGLAGERISLPARILAVADCYIAMISHRPFREAKKPADAIQEIQKCAGTQFDPKVVDAFLKVLSENKEMGDSDETVV